MAREATSASSASTQPIRGVQSLLQVQAQCWGRPGLIARELAWRWSFGIPALCVLFFYGRHLLAAHTGIEDFSLQQPLAAAHILRSAYDALRPQVLALWWLAPMLMLGWAIASGLGRAWVFRALAPQSRPRPGAMCLLQLLRVAALVATWLAWFASVQWTARHSIFSIPAGAESNLVGFAAWLICLSLGSFVVWALWSWVLSIAAVLVAVDGRSLGAALAGSLRLGPLTARLVEVNLVLGIVKLALIVLAMVFSAVPLPFEAQMSGHALYFWWAFVGVLFLAASDFFQVARLAAFTEFWRHNLLRS